MAHDVPLVVPDGFVLVQASAGGLDPAGGAGSEGKMPSPQ
jgi:hypothetical protein